ncbi:MAG: hypothetical protein Q9222_005937 [Ikaeria aurantiellina]
MASSMALSASRVYKRFEGAISGISSDSSEKHRLSLGITKFWRRRVLRHDGTNATDFEYDSWSDDYTSTRSDDYDGSDSKTEYDNWSQADGHASGDWFHPEDVKQDGDWGERGTWARGCSTDTTLPVIDEDEPAPPKPLSFVDPLADNPDDGFLESFLRQHRLIDILPETKQKVAVHLHTICRDASYDFVAAHAPDMLKLMCLKSGDEMEFVPWISLINGLRRQKRAPTDSSRWPNEYTNFEWLIGKDDNIARLRQLAFHSQWDYDSRMIKDVVWYLDQLNDKRRRRQVADALEELYHSECQNHSELHHRPNSSQDLDLSIMYNSPSKLNPSPQITTSHQFLAAYTTTIATSLFNFAQHHFPTSLTDCKRTSAADIEMKEYLPVFGSLFRNALPDEATADRFTGLLYAATGIRNQAAHCCDDVLRHMQQEEEEGMVYGWGNDDEGVEEAENPGWLMYTNAQALTTILGDEIAARKLRIVTSVANVNFCAAVKKACQEKETRSIREWKVLAAAASRERGRWSEHGAQEIIHNHLRGSETYFENEARAAEDRLFGREAAAILRDWEVLR